MTNGPHSEHPACLKCGLYKRDEKGDKCSHPFMESLHFVNGEPVKGPPRDSHKYTLIVGGAPEPEADATGDLMDGDELILLVKAAEKAGVLNQVWYTPGVLCRAVGSKTSQEGRLTKGEIKRCWTKHIEPIVKENPPRAILCAGPVGSQAVLQNMNARGTEGQWQKTARGTMAYTLRSPEELLLNPDDVEGKEKFMAAFTYAFEHREESIICDIPYVVGLTLEVVKEWFGPVLESLKDLNVQPLSWDTETSSVHERWRNGGANFKVCLWSFDHPSQPDPLLIPTTGYHPLETPTIESVKTWLMEPQEERKIIAYLKDEVMEVEEVGKLGQNLQYDELAAWVAYGIMVKGFRADTQILDFLIDPDVKVHGLDTLTKRYLPSVPHYWDALEKWLSEHPGEVENYGYTRVPPNILFPYAAWDTKVVSMLYPVYMAILEERKNDGWFIIAQDPPDTTTLSPKDYARYGRSVHHKVCTHLERTGIAVDTDLLGLVRLHYTKELQEHSKNLDADEKLIEFERTLLPNIVSKSSASAKAWKNHGIPHKINWKSGNEVQAFFLDFLKLPVLTRTEKGAPCMDAANIDKYAVHPHNCAAAVHLAKWRKSDKFITSFLNPLDEEKGVLNGNIIHANYKSASTATGRLSCGSSYPMQAIPREGNIKKIFISRYPGGWMITRDYSGIEVRILAMVSKDPTLCKAFREGKDPHFITQQFFFREKADAKNKTQRSICKRALFGRLYGQGDKGLFDLLTSEGIISVDTGQPITLEECKRFNEMIDQLYPGVAKWVALAHEQGLSHFHCCSLFGFIRQLPGAKFFERKEQLRKQYTWDQLKENKSYRRISAMVAEAERHSQNAPIQSSASDLTVFAAYIIQRRLEFEEITAHVVAIVHDDIWVDVARTEDVPRVSAIMRDVMNNPQDWLPSLLPGFECPWWDVPIIGEAEIGLSPMDAFPVVQEPTCGSIFEPVETMGELLLKVSADIATEQNLVGAVLDADGKKAVVPWIGNEGGIRTALGFKRLSL